MKQVISFKKEIAFKTMIGEITSISLEHTLHFCTDSTIEGDLVVAGTYKMTEASTLEEEFHYALPVDIMLTSDLEEADRSIAIDHFTYQILNEEMLEIDVELLVKGLEKVEVIEEELPVEADFIEEEPVEELIRKEESEEVREEKEEVLEVMTSIEETRDENELKSSSEISDQQKIMEQLTEVKEAEPMMKEEEPVMVIEEAVMAPVEEKVEIMEPVMKEEKTIVQEEGESVPVMNSIFSAFANTDETYTTYSVYILREEDSLEEVLNKYNVTREELGYYNQLDDLKVGSKLIIPTSMKEG